MDDRQAGLRSKRAREGALPGPRHPSHDDAAADRQGGITHRRQCPSNAIGAQPFGTTRAVTTPHRRARFGVPRSRTAVGQRDRRTGDRIVFENAEQHFGTQWSLTGSASNARTRVPALERSCLRKRGLTTGPSSHARRERRIKAAPMQPVQHPLAQIGCPFAFTPRMDLLGGSRFSEIARDLEWADPPTV